MKIVKPLRLGVMSRPYTMQRRSKLGLSVLALASLSEPALLQPEADLWTLAGEALGDDGVLDLGVPKPCAEFLVSRSEERRVGKECVGTCRSRVSPSHYKKKHNKTINI